MKKAAEQISFEESLHKLEEIAGVLKSTDTSLEDSLKLYGEGIKHYKNCKSILEDAKQKVSMFDKELDAETDLI